MSVVNCGGNYGVAQCTILLRQIGKACAAMAAMFHDENVAFPPDNDLITGDGMF